MNAHLIDFVMTVHVSLPLLCSAVLNVRTVQKGMVAAFGVRWRPVSALRVRELEFVLVQYLFVEY